ncbi:hypothetical protein KKC22_06125, partial [Myxococcota bacterium]|nr:hypothetical protein [Myxococcota bacterium]
LSTIATLSCGTGHTCALTTGGIVYCWGQNNHGQLGDLTNTNRTTPVQIDGHIEATAVTTYGAHTCLIHAILGTTKCFGWNLYGQLGDGTTTSRNTATDVSTALRFTAVSPGGTHTCALNADRELFCWGNNSDGQLGNLTTTSSLLPARAILPTDEYGL